MAKMIKFDLLIDGTKVKTFEELQDNLHADILTYLKNAKLAKWFLSRDMADKAEATQAIDLTQSDLALMMALCEVLELEADEDILTDMLAMPEQLAKAQQAASASNAVVEVQEEAEDDTPPAPTYRMDWSGKDMSGRHFDGEDFSNCNFEGVNFSKASLKGTNLKNANLKNAILDDTDFSRANLESAILTKATLHKTLFSEASLKHVDLTHSELRGVDFSDASMEYVDLSNSVIYGLTLSNANLEHAKFNDAIFSRYVAPLSTTYDGSLAGMMSARMSYRMQTTDFEGVDISYADFSFADLKDCSFYGAIGSDTAKMTGAINFQGFDE